MIRVFLLWLACAPLVVTAAPREWSPAQFGVVADGVTPATAALQQAIDTAHAAGGGLVRVGAGRYLIGTLELRSGVTLHLEKDATLLGSPRIADYRRGNWPALIKARGQQHVGISGEGTIDGQGKLVAEDTLRLYRAGEYLAFFPGLKADEKIFTGIGTDKQPWIDPHAMQREGTLAERIAPHTREDVATWRVDEFVRPQLLEFWQCDDVRVSGIVLRNPANWTQTYRECTDVVIAQLQVHSTSYWNNDGLDIVNCRRLRVEDCDIDAADDGICLKSDPSTAGRTCEDITIARCRIRSSASALKLGTASHTVFRHIRADGLEIHDTYRSAVALEVVDGGVLEDVQVSHLRARNTGNAFFLRIGQRNRDKPPGVLRNVVLSDIEVEIPAGKPDAGFEHEGPPLAFPANVMPSSIAGLPDRPVENVLLRNVTIVYAGGGRRDVAELPLSRLGSVPEKRENYPEFSMFGELPAWGIYLRHAQGVTFENVALRLLAADYRPALVADRAAELRFTGMEIAAPSAGIPIVALAGASAAGLGTITGPGSADERVRRMPAPVDEAAAPR